MPEKKRTRIGSMLIAGTVMIAYKKRTRLNGRKLLRRPCLGEVL